MSLAIRSIVHGLTGLLVAATLAPAGAQQIYRIVGPDGRVSFSDKPPMVEGAKAAPVTTGSGGSGGGALPYELRQVTGKYPVTLYSGKDCAPCGTGRAYLTGRGIPFTEKSVTSNEDIDALQRLSGSSSVPFLTIGGQQLRGFSETEWSQFLDAAGYPKNSILPAAYRQTPVTPLVAAQQTNRPAAEAPSTTADGDGKSTSQAVNRRLRASNAETRTPATPPAAANNPAGIQF
ncbi:MAG: glutaredoxin family protein [Ramlibacter sp.]|nr:glutaredoxin family protein [Ramlibacter sp.]